MWMGRNQGGGERKEGEREGDEGREKGSSRQGMKEKG